jgi:hypothetical protein
VSRTGLARLFKSIPIFIVLADQKGNGILLANLFQRSQADVSTSNFPSSYEFEGCTPREISDSLEFANSIENDI